MLKYDYFSTLHTLTDKSCEAVEYAGKKRVQSHIKISKIRADSYKILCELERALFSEFLPPLDRASIAEYAHALCEITDAALVYSNSSPLQYSAISGNGFYLSSLSLCEILKETVQMLEKIKRSSEIPRVDEFRKAKTQALECICEGACTAQIFVARQELLCTISYAFDVLVKLILKNI